jgi:hypothetical protein
VVVGGRGGGGVEGCVLKNKNVCVWRGGAVGWRCRHDAPTVVTASTYSTRCMLTHFWSYCCVLCLAVLCHAMLCCAVLCCAVLCCAVLCCAVLCCAVLCCAVLCCDVL